MHEEARRFRTAQRGAATPGQAPASCMHRVMHARRHVRKSRARRCAGTQARPASVRSAAESSVRGRRGARQDPRNVRVRSPSGMRDAQGCGIGSGVARDEDVGEGVVQELPFVAQMAVICRGVLQPAGLVIGRRIRVRSLGAAKGRPQVRHGVQRRAGRRQRGDQAKPYQCGKARRAPQSAATGSAMDTRQGIPLLARDGLPLRRACSFL